MSEGKEGPCGTAQLLEDILRACFGDHFDRAYKMAHSEHGDALPQHAAQRH